MTKKEYEDLLALSNDVNSLVIRKNSSSSESMEDYDFDFVRSLAFHFLDGRDIKNEILNDIPLRERPNFSRAVNIISTFNSWTRISVHNRNPNGDILKSVQFVTAKLEEVVATKTQEITTQEIKVFYSWQSTTEKKTNNYFIKGAIRDALKEIKKSYPIEERDNQVATISLDQDTQGVSGSPDIFNTICRKIDECSIFIADVTLVNNNMCNSNVMLELGYAFKSIGDSKIILVFNENYGQMSSLPFDLHTKRITRYNSSLESDLKSDQNKLKEIFKTAINSIISSQMLED